MKQITIFVVLIALILVGCGTTTEVVEDVEELHVAMILPLTGKAASPGQDFHRGIMIAEKEIDNKRVVLHVQDDMTSPKEAVNALRGLIATQDIDMVVTLQASVVQPLIPIAEEEDIPIVASLASLRGFPAMSEKSALLYPTPEIEMGKAVEFAHEQDYKNVATLTVMDEFGETERGLFTENINRDIVYNEGFEKTNVDYRTHLLKIRELNPDAMMFIGYQPHLVNFLQQRHELGMTDIPVIGTMQIQAEDVRKQTIGLHENVFSVVPVSLLENPESGEFVAKFQHEYNADPDFMAPFGYDTMLVLDQIQKHGGEVSDALLDIEVDGLNGHIDFNEKGEFDMELAVVAVKDKAVVG